MRDGLHTGRDWTPTMGVRSVYSPLQPTSPSLAIWDRLGVDKGPCSAVGTPDQASGRVTRASLAMPEPGCQVS